MEGYGQVNRVSLASAYYNDFPITKTHHIGSTKLIYFNELQPKYKYYLRLLALFLLFIFFCADVAGMEIFMQLHERIREVRSIIGLSQAKFAERMAISSSYLADIELNNKVATERIIRLLAAEFNVNDHWLRTGEGVMFNDGMDKQTVRLISVFKSMSQHFKECALIQMEELLNLQGKN